MSRTGLNVNDHRQLGRQGEAHARRFLEARGLIFRDANWRCAAGELDLVMLDGEDVVFVEVKTRFGERFGPAEETVSKAQMRRLLAAADWYIADHDGLHDRIWRVDVVGITLGPRGEVVRIAHSPNAIVAG